MAKANNPVPAPGDRLLWREAVRSVAPLRGRAAAVSPASGSTAPATIEERRGGQPVRPPALDHFSGVDRANAERLKRGLHRIDARLDLHGMIQSEAHRILAEFVHASRDA